MKILLTNDDGYRADGINQVYSALLNAGHDVIMVAPELNSSGASQSIAVYQPISITQVHSRMYFVASTPADSVRLGLQVVYETQENYPDLVISGVNMGANIGEDILYSGTVGAAREGTIHGIASIAFSTPGAKFDYLADSAKVVVDLVDRISKNPETLANPFLWNVNIPNIPYDKICGYEATKLAKLPPHQPLKQQVTPRGNIIYWQGGSSEPHDAPLGSDLDVYLKGDKVSITPLGILPTDYRQMPIITALTVS